MYPSRVPLATRAGVGGDQRVCQRCEQRGHLIFECKNPRPYKTRPTRTQVLADPSLAQSRRSIEEPTEELRRKDTATQILAERQNSRRRGGSISSSSSDSDEDSLSHPSSCSTCSSHSPRSPSRSPSTHSRPNSLSRSEDENTVSHPRDPHGSPDMQKRRKLSLPT